jgi:hypothetical protein
MTSRFVQLSLEAFSDLLQRFEFTRTIDAIHMHHTWRPRQEDYNELATIEAMWRYHTQQNGWRDIAQHITIAPDGTIWTGRDWNLPPASAAGFNGNAAVGPFMFETIGDFDRGRDRLSGSQREAVVGVIALVQQHFRLGPDSLRFHRSMTQQKTCPGNALDLDDLKSEVAAARAAVPAGGASRRAVWAGPEKVRPHPQAAEALRIWRERPLTRALDPFDAELEESTMSDTQADLLAGVTGGTRRAPGAQARAARGSELTPAMLAALRPHVINLNQGRFSDEGLFRTSTADVDAIFDDHLARAAQEAQADQRPLRVLFWAHGGLISEASGLWIAHQQTMWWKRNRIYPIHFVWETGFCDALKQILSGARQAAPRGVPRDFWDHTTDLAVEAAARTLGGGKIWAAMKRSAELASAPQGGATYVARKLIKLCESRPGQIELHAVGHSAGSIFHAHFLSMAFAMGVPPFKTLQLLAPAIRIDTFKSQLLQHIGKAIGSLTMFTMQRDWEQDDHVAQIYRKSLLYLIHYALEADRKTPILGLEVSVRDDAACANLFDLRGVRGRQAEVVWSVTEATSGANASTSRTHGGFDNDRATMDSVAHRVLGAPPELTFPEEAIERGRDIWSGQSDLPFRLEPFVTPVNGIDAAPAAWKPVTATPAAGVNNDGSSGRRRALCVGIDRYPTSPLAGCVADAHDWAGALEALGFTTALLLDEAATRSRILDDLRGLIVDSRPGDVVVFQFSGHGTEVEDLDGDEVDGTNGARDEALCPYDIAQGAFLIDDDLAGVFAAIPDGVNVTCFVDCCHSGTVTRVMVGPVTDRGGRDRRARFLPVTAEWQAAHRRFREGLRTGRGRAPAHTAADMRQVVFSACKDYEVAFETDGHGEFTVRATRLLSGGIASLTHDEFQRRVTAAFGEAPRQHPELDCAPAALGRGLLGSLVPASSSTTDGRAAPGRSPVADVAQALRHLADALVQQG